MKILALDPSSAIVGASYWDAGRIVSLDRLKARGTDWLAKVESIAADLRQAARGRSWRPEVVALEMVSMGINSQAGFSLSETRGFLKHEVRALWPGVRILDVHPSRAAAVGGAAEFRGRTRDERKAGTAAFALEVLARQGVPIPAGGLTEDVADSVVIGIAAIWELGDAVVGVGRKKTTGWAAVVLPTVADLARGVGEIGERGRGM